MAGLFKKLRGTIENYFQLGIGAASHGIKDNTNGVEARTQNDANQSNFVSKQANYDNQCTNLLDLKQRDVLLEFNFDGAVGLPAGPPPGTYGICHTTGGAFNQGEVWILTGPGVGNLIPMYKMQNVCNQVAFSVGGFGMIANGFYIATIGAAPFNWSLFGDGTAGAAGEIREIIVPFRSADFVGGGFQLYSTSTVPNNSMVSRTSVRVINRFTVAVGLFDGTIDVSVPNIAGTRLMVGTDSNLDYPNNTQFDNDNYIGIPGGGGGFVELNLLEGSALPIAGDGFAVVEYCATPLP